MNISVNAEMAEQILRGFHIPAKPEVLNNLHKLISTGTASPDNVAETASSDVGLSAAILKTINSPFYRMARQIADIQQAVVLLGVDTVTTLIAAYEIKRLMSQKACISLERFWDEATDVAKTMAYIGREINQSVPAEDLYAVGLFHDCGIPALAMKFMNYKELLIESNENHDVSIIQLEEQHYNTNHAVVGYYISSSWDLPKEICDVILRHHEEKTLDRLETDYFITSYSILKLAENIVERTRRFHSKAEWNGIKDGVLETLGLTDADYSDLEEDAGDIVLT